MMMTMMFVMICCHHAGGCDIGGYTCNHIRYLMFNTITAATAMVIMVVLVVIMVAGTDYDYAWYYLINDDDEMIM